jgi:hypothetical protein
MAVAHHHHITTLNHHHPLPAGSIKLVSSSGRLDKAVPAHAGAVLCARWSPDGEQQRR